MPSAPIGERKRRRGAGVRALAALAAVLSAATGMPLAALDGRAVPDNPRYAEGFRFQPAAGGTLLHVGLPAAPSGGGQWRYLLRRRRASDDAPRSPATPPATRDATPTPIIEIPVRRIATLSTTHLPPIVELGMLDRLVAHNGMRWVYAPQIQRRRQTGAVVDIGAGGRIDIERLIVQRPDLIVAYPDLDGASLAILQRLEIPIVMNLEYLEPTPLGRSEWILLFGALLDAQPEARRLFEAIATRYTALRRRVAAAQIPDADRPTVLTGAPWGSQWPTAGGRSYEAALIADAGGRYVWRADRSGGTRMLDFEAVYAVARHADIWIGAGVWRNLHDLRGAAPRLADFKALRLGRVYNNDARITPGGGVDYYESGVLHVDRVLADLIAILHPQLADDAPLVYYRRLE